MTAATIVVTGIGMNTPVGTTAPATCAALRARVSRLRAWAGFSFAGERIVAAGLREHSPEGPWVGRAVAMLSPVIHEALWQAAVYDHSAHRGRRVGLFVATPPATRPGVTGGDYDDFVAHLKDVWWDLARNERLWLVDRDRVGGALALAEACQALAAGEIEVAVVVGVESQLCAQHLEALLEAGRLHVAGRPNGIVPGEGAAALVLETAAAAHARGAPPLVQIAALALEAEGEGWSPARPSEAAGLIRALQTALSARPGAAAVQRVIVDHNGERWRYRDWALAEARALRGLANGWRLWHPVDSVGDAGAGFVPLAVGMAATALGRGYGGDGSILIAASNDSGERAALVVAHSHRSRA